MSNVMGSVYCSGKVKTTMPKYSDPKGGKKGQSSGEVRHENKIEHLNNMPKGKKGY